MIVGVFRDFDQPQIKNFRCDRANRWAQIKNPRSFGCKWVVLSQHLACLRTEICAVRKRSIDSLDILITWTLYKLACPLSGMEFCSHDWIHFQTQQPRFYTQKYNDSINKAYTAPSRQSSPDANDSICAINFLMEQHKLGKQTHNSCRKNTD